MTRLTRSGTRATVEAILGQPTKIGRQRLARQFAHEVLRATATGRCTDPRYTSREMLARSFEESWTRAGFSGCHRYVGLRRVRVGAVEPIYSW